jgi:hypothetical protein
MGETCGALTAAVLALGCVVGRERLEDHAQYGVAMAEATRVYERFREQIGHTLYHEIHKIRFGKVYHLALPAERKAFHQEGGHAQSGCPEVCGVAARIAAEAIMDIRERA